MPTDTSTPNWVCDICGARFGANLAAAQRCEGAGPPFTLPDGELCLFYEEGFNGGQYTLVTLHPAPQIGTRARAYNSDSGHLATYEAQGDRYEGKNRTWDQDIFRPGVPGRLNVLANSYRSGLESRGLLPHTGGRSKVPGWPYKLVGLPVGPERPADIDRGLVVPEIVRPLTSEVAAALEMVGARPAFAGATDYRGAAWAAAVIAAEETARRDGLPQGTYDPARLASWLAQADKTRLLAQAAERQRHWWDGEKVTAPRFHVLARTGLSPSKLNRAQRAVIDAAGVPWPARTGAADYARLLISTVLGETMTPTVAEQAGPRLFSTVRHRIAVKSSKGGVGKSTVTAALAAALAEAGQRVLLIDMNLPNPGQHVLWRLGPAETDAAARLIRGQAVEIAPGGAGSLRVFSHGQLSGGGRTAQIEVGRAGEWLTFLAGTLDLRGITAVVFDLPPGWDNVHQHVFDGHQVALTGIVHVTTGDPLAWQTEVIPQVTRGDTPRWLVENLSRARGPLICGQGDAEIRLYGSSGQDVAGLADRQGAAYAGSLPWEPEPIRLAQTPEIRALAAAVAA